MRPLDTHLTGCDRIVSDWQGLGWILDNLVNFTIDDNDRCVRWEVQSASTVDQRVGESLGRMMLYSNCSTDLA